MDLIRVCIYHPENKTELTLELPRETRFADLTPLLREKAFVDGRKVGWRYVYQEHLCGLTHTLGDYIPEGGSEIRLQLFGFSQVLV